MRGRTAALVASALKLQNVRFGAWAAVAVDRSERPLRVRNPPLDDAPMDQLLFRGIKSAPGTEGTGSCQIG
jgi:hypothetical protein